MYIKVVIVFVCFSLKLSFIYYSYTETVNSVEWLIRGCFIVTAMMLQTGPVSKM